MQSSGSRRQTVDLVAGATIITQMGGLGDVVLTSQLVTALRQSDPKGPVMLVCRAATAGIVECFPERPDRTIAIDADPGRWQGLESAVLPNIAELRAALVGITAGQVIAAEYRPHWFTRVVAAITGAESATGAGGRVESDPLYRVIIAREQLADVEWTGPEVGTDAHILDRLNALAVYTGGSGTVFPRWQVSEASERAARAYLQSVGLTWKDYIVVVPCGAAGIAYKRWPLDRFASVLNSLRTDDSCPVLLLGTVREREDLDRLSGMLEGFGPIGVYAGTNTDLATVCGLIAGAHSYLGNDTGPMHIAGAFDVPSLAIYGGGHWPVYKPWARGAIGFIEELPCSNCDWDCVLGRGLCVEAIPVEPVADAMRRIRAGEVTESPSVVNTRRTPPEVLCVLSEATARYREAQADRAKRYESIVQLKRVAAEQGNAIEELITTADERLESWNTEAEKRRADVDQLTHEIALRDDRIRELEQESGQRLTALKFESSALAALRREADLRNDALRRAEDDLRAKDQLIASLETSSADRLRLLQKADGELKRIAAEGEQRMADVRTLTAVVSARDEEIAKVRNIAAERLQSLNALKAAFDRVSTEARERSSGLEHLTSAIERQREEIGRLRDTAEDRLRALQSTTDALHRLEAEADKRSDGLKTLTAALHDRDQRIAQVEACAADRLQALLATSAAAEQLRHEAAKHEAAMQELTAIISAKDADIAVLRATAEERLAALLATTAAADRLHDEAEKRKAGLDELTAIIAARDAQIAEATNTAHERLTALERLDEAASELRSQLEERRAAIELAAVELQRRDTRIVELASDLAAVSEQLDVAKRRIAELEAANEGLTARSEKAGDAERAAAEQWQNEAAKRLEAIENLSEIISARDARILQLEKTSEERLQELVKASREIERLQADVAARTASSQDAESKADAARREAGQLERAILRLKRQIEILEQQNVALEDQNLYNFLVRRWGGVRRRPPEHPHT